MKTMKDSFGFIERADLVKDVSPIAEYRTDEKCPHLEVTLGVDAVLYFR